jgi:peptide/nickel transport system ATP-binding protein
MNQPLVQISNLTIGYTSQQGQVMQAVRDVSLTLQRGETLGIVGESGCGKSTLGIALLGYLRGGSSVLGGRVLIDGIDVFGLSQRELERLRGGRVGLVAQNSGRALTPTMRISTQINEALALHTGITGSAAYQRAVELLHQMRLPHPEVLLTRYPHQLSGGQQQRVAIAMALAGEPELLILDELTTGLDVTTQAHILKLLNDVVRASGATLVYISHDLGVIAHVSTRVAVMYAGEVVEYAPAADVFQRPLHPYTRGLLASIPRLQMSQIPRAMPGTPPALSDSRAGCAFTPRCPFATELCKEANPPLEPVASVSPTRHMVRCHHWEHVSTVPAGREPQQNGHAAEQRTSPQPVLDLADVDISYAHMGWLAHLRRRAMPPPTVSNINLTVYKGETLALVGESGSGKSTIVRSIAGLKLPHRGKITFDTNLLLILQESENAPLVLNGRSAITV